MSVIKTVMSSLEKSTVKQIFFGVVFFFRLRLLFVLYRVLHLCFV